MEDIKQLKLQIKSHEKYIAGLEKTKEHYEALILTGKQLITEIENRIYEIEANK